MLALFLIPLLSFAECPQIEGDYFCTGAEVEYVQSIKTLNLKDVNVYVIAAQEGEFDSFVANGKERPYSTTREGMNIVGKVNSHCVAGVVKTNLKGKVEGLDHYDVEVEMVIFPKEGSVYQNMDVMVNGELLFRREEICVPI